MQKERKEGGSVLPLEGPGPFLFFLRCHRGKGKLSIFFIIRLFFSGGKGQGKAGREKISMMETFLLSHADTGNYVLHIYPLKIVL